MFSGDDVKMLLEVAAPIGAGVWYMRGILVKIEMTLANLGERIGKVEGTGVDHSKRLRHMELRHALAGRPKDTLGHESR